MCRDYMTNEAEEEYEATIREKAERIAKKKGRSVEEVIEELEEEKRRILLGIDSD